jgi:hypothetical protein
MRRHDQDDGGAAVRFGKLIGEVLGSTVVRVVAALVPVILVLGAVADITNLDTSRLPWHHGGTPGGGGGTSHTEPSVTPSATPSVTPSTTPSVTPSVTITSTDDPGTSTDHGSSTGGGPHPGSAHDSPEAEHTTRTGPTPTHGTTQPAEATGRITSPDGGATVSGNAVTVKGTSSGVPASRTLYVVVERSHQFFFYPAAGTGAWTATGVGLGPADRGDDPPDWVFTVSLMTASSSADAAVQQAWKSEEFNTEGMGSLPAGFVRLDGITVTRTG